MIDFWLQFILLGPVFKNYQFFAILNYGISFCDFHALVFYSIILIKALWTGFKLHIAKTTLPFWMGLMAVAVLLSIIPSLMFYPDGRLFQFFKSSVHFYFAFFLAFFGLLYLIKTKYLVGLAKVFMVVILLANMYAPYQLIARALDMPGGWIKLNNESIKGREAKYMEEINQLSLKFENFYRATSIFYEPSQLATVNITLMAMFFALSKHPRRKSIVSDKFFKLSLTFSVIALFLAFSLTGLVGLGFIFFFYLFLERNISFKKILMVIGLFAIVLVVADRVVEYYTNQSVLELFYVRLSNILGFSKVGISGESFTTRLGSGEKSINAWTSSPLVGLGLGLTFSFREFDLVFSDYTIMAALAETGLIGFIAIEFIQFVSIYHLYRLKKKYYEQFDDHLKFLIEWAFYFMLVLIFLNHVTSNLLINEFLWSGMFVIFATITQAYYQLNFKMYVIEVNRYPLKKILDYRHKLARRSA